MTKGYAEFKAEAARMRAGHDDSSLKMSLEVQAKEIERLREALRFYANRKSWEYRGSGVVSAVDDNGDSARKALHTEDAEGGGDG